MTLKELIYAEINKIEEDNLDELYEFVKQLVIAKTAANPKSGILNKLKRIKIQAPVDFILTQPTFGELGTLLKYQKNRINVVYQF
jgi:hypothetical protein